MNQETFVIVLATIIGMFALCVGVIAAWWIERSAWNKERAKLLDRLMARTLGEYKAYEEPQTEPTRIVQTIDDDAELEYARTHGLMVMKHEPSPEEIEEQEMYERVGT